MSFVLNILTSSLAHSVELSSYRPISLLPNLSKVFESILKDKINNHISSNKLIPDEQYGFRRHLSTTHAISAVTTNVYSHLLRNKFVGAVLIDLEKAFDSVWLEGLLFKLCQKKFPEYLILIIWDMVEGKNFYIKGTDPNIRFYLDHGVQQGSVTGPTLFNVYFSDLLHLFGLNSNENLTADMFADDLIVKYADNTPTKVQDKLNIVTNDINKYCATWHLKMKFEKCETILFRPPIGNINSKNRKGWKEFMVTVLNNNTRTPIPHRNVVKYLGVYLDSLMRMHVHTKNQITKAKNAVKANSNLFNSPYLNSRAKLICYMLLIRPLLTYASPIWFNMSAGTAEKLRVLERSCIRPCLGLYRTPESKYQKYYSNTIIYNKAAIPRIDNFIIKITREYYRKAFIINHNIIKKQLAIIPRDAIEQCNKGYVSPATFMYLDKMGIIQNKDNTPELYNISRNSRDKKIFHANLNNLCGRRSKYIYSKSIPEIDKKYYYQDSDIYWWLMPEDSEVRQ